MRAMAYFNDPMGHSQNSLSVIHFVFYFGVHKFINEGVSATCFIMIWKSKNGFWIQVSERVYLDTPPLPEYTVVLRANS